MHEVEELLALSTENLDELADNTPVAFKRPAPAHPIEPRIGAYEIVREIGRGGMGAVYLARRADGQFEKEVAIKLLKRGTDTDEVLRRFREERRILARLDHPNIARLIDAGTTQAGLPYFVMEYVAGLPITRYVAKEKVPIAGRLQLFLKVCAAVQFAHQHQVVHRDLKPGNIVVTPEGEPKLLDFGIAKLLTPTDDTVLVTRTEQRRLTPACASPEQARGEPVTPASDVYALGALLYELVTDVSPHRFSSPQPASEEIARVVCDVEAVRPSLALENPERRRELRGDLDTIALTALRKEPERRYASVAELAEDARRHLAGRPIVARKNTASYITTRFLRRNHRRITAALALAGVGLIVGALLFRSAIQPRRPIDPMTARSDVASNPPTSDLVAYDLFLRGQALMNDIATSTDWEGDNRRAIDLLERAVTHDPTFALAYAQLVSMHVNLYVWVEHSETRLAQAKAALQQAERLAPDNADTYAAAGELAEALGDTSRAFERFGLAHRVRPNDEVILSRLAQAEENLGMWDEAIRDMEKARKIAPRNSNVPNYLKGMYAGRRDYGTSDRICDEAIAQFPNGPIYYRAQKVSNSLDRGDPQQARVRFGDLPEKFNASGYRSLLSLRICLAERDYDRFSREFANLAWDRFIEDFKLNAELMRVLVAEQEGDRATIQSILIPRREKVARDGLESSHTDLGPIASRTAKLARIDSHLGRIEEALRESDDAVANTSDPVGKPTQEIIRAEVLMRAGQTDAALDILEQVARVPYGPSYGELLGLRWDGLRANPRFERIVNQLAETAK
jgi:serine/threonine protein kinase